MTIRLYNLLFESQDSDELYIKVSRYFLNLFRINLDNLKFIPPAQYELRPEKSSYEDYVKTTGDIGTYIRDDQDYQSILSEFRILFLPYNTEETGGVGGIMDEEGNMMIPIKTWDQFEPKPDDIVEQIKEYFSSSRFIGIFNHEIGHFINAIRSGRSGARVSGRDKAKLRGLPGQDPKLGQSISYINSTEEMQARLNEFNNYLDDLAEMPIKEIETKDQLGYNLIDTIQRNDIDKFIDFALQTSSLYLMNSDKFLQKLKQKLYARLADSFSRMKNTKAVQELKAIKDSETEVL